MPVQRLGNTQAVFSLDLLQIEQQIIHLGAVTGVEEALSKRIGTDRTTDAERRGDLRRHRGDQLRHLTNLGVQIGTDARLRGNELEEYLGLS